MNTIPALFFSLIQQLIQGSSQEGLEEVTPKEEGTLEKLEGHASEVAETLNQSEAVQEASGTVLQPIFELGQYMDFPSFFWIAFALMIAGVVSFAGQLVFAKFILLFKGSLNLREIISDAFCLIISLVGLVLTTQAAASHTSFTDNSIAVLSATGVGAFVGLIFYWWGQKTEFQAARRIPEQSQK